MFRSITQTGEQYSEKRYRFIRVVYVLLDILIVLLVARAAFVMVPSISNVVGDVIISMTDVLVRPFMGILDPFVIDEIIIVWDVIFAIIVYDIGITIFVKILKKVMKIE